MGLKAFGSGTSLLVSRTNKDSEREKASNVPTQLCVIGVTVCVSERMLKIRSHRHRL